MAHLPNQNDSGNYNVCSFWEQDIRSERARRLTETDWMASSDVTMGAAWKTYRQALRDFPDNATYDEDGICNNWPVDPDKYYE